MTLGYTEDGRRQRRKVSGTTKAAVVDKLRDLHNDLDKGTVPKTGYARYTVRQAAEDWLANGLEGRSAKTVTTNRNVLGPVLAVIAAARTLPVTELRPGLKDVAGPPPSCTPTSCSAC